MKWYWSRVSSQRAHLQEPDYFRDRIPLEYQYLKDSFSEKLFSSGIRWLHIDDKRASTVSWLLQVAAGSMHETLPEKEFPPGTAHLLEHSIFLNMTSEERLRFKDWNAHTASETTGYQFVSTRELFLDNFNLTLRLLFNYQLNRESLREVNAVNNEYSLVTQVPAERPHRIPPRPLHQAASCQRGNPRQEAAALHR